jgi:hypothetical protein
MSSGFGSAPHFTGHDISAKKALTGVKALVILAGESIRDSRRLLVLSRQDELVGVLSLNDVAIRGNAAGRSSEVLRAIAKAA